MGHERLNALFAVICSQVEARTRPTWTRKLELQFSRCKLHTGGEKSYDKEVKSERRAAS